MIYLFNILAPSLGKIGEPSTASTGDFGDLFMIWPACISFCRFFEAKPTRATFPLDATSGTTMPEENFELICSADFGVPNGWCRVRLWQ